MAKSSVIPAISGKKVDQIPAATNKIIEEIDLNSFENIKYFVVFESLDETKKKSMEVQVSNIGGSVESVVSGRIGTGIDLIVNPQVNALKFEMSITNNENFAVNVSFARLTL